ncbi:DnaJ domain-containing protein [Sinomonas sp. P47F7]|uniref:DnaJ domain-containing protein n=1 Tax=Sinomonas sp. P47F7 TaxID=3410987 RepID=UPI003BF610A4
MRSADFYTLLGVERTATNEEIRRAFRRLVRELHPDGQAGEGADPERLREVLEAYAVLGSPDRRAAYDQALRRAEATSLLWADFPSRVAPLRRAWSVFDDPEILRTLFRWWYP